MQFRDFKHVTPLQLRFSDLDRLGHVNNVIYLTYFELGRINYFNAVYKEKINWDKEGFILGQS